MPHSELISTNPCTDAVVWQGPMATGEDVAVAINKASKAFTTWSSFSLTDRVEVAQRYAALVTKASDTFAKLIAEETGKPFWEAKTEVASVAAKVEISVFAQRERTGTSAVSDGNTSRVLRHKPHGVLAVLGPYNFPAHLPNGHIVPALIAGNTIVFKPSEWTPAVSLYMAELWYEAGLPQDALKLVIGDANTGRAVSQHTDIDGLLFTGSAPTGIALHSQFAGQPNKILALEMGGNNPLIVWDVQDAQTAAQIIVASAYQTAGQRCTCARRLIIPKGSAGQQVVDAVLLLIDRLIVGAQFDEPQPFMGPVIGNSIADKLVAQAQNLHERGGIELRPLRRIALGKPYLTPSLMDVTSISKRSDDEIFGPLLQIIRVKDFSDALQEANATQFGLAAGLVGGDRGLYERFLRSIHAGIVNWNTPLTGAASASPFGGVGMSGNHRPSAYYAADYAAYPVAGLEQSLPALNALIGLKP